MALENTANFNKMKRKLKTVINKLPRTIGAVAVKEFKGNFRTQSFFNGSKWSPRIHDSRKGAAVLIQSGRLRRSIKIVKISNRYVVIGSNVPYAEIHNEGGQIKGSQNISAHQRKAHSRTSGGINVKVKAHTVKSHTRTANSKIPKRQFMGNDKALENKITKKIVSQIDNAIK